MAFLQTGGLRQLIQGCLLGSLIFTLHSSPAHAEDLGFFTPAPPWSAPADDVAEPIPAGDTPATFSPANARAELAPYLDLFERLIAIKTDLSEGQIPAPLTLRQFYGDFLKVQTGLAHSNMALPLLDRAALILEVIQTEIETGFANLSREAPGVLEKIYLAATQQEIENDLWFLMKDLSSAKRYLLQEVAGTGADAIAEYTMVIEQISEYLVSSPALMMATESGVQDLLDRSRSCSQSELADAETWLCLRSQFLGN